MQGRSPCRLLKQGKLTAEKAEVKRYSVCDLRPFATGAEIYRELVAAVGLDDPAARALREALSRLAVGCHTYRPPEKAARYGEARERASAAVASLLLDGPVDDEARAALAGRIEQEMLPQVGSLLRYTERRRRRERFDRFGA